MKEYFCWRCKKVMPFLDEKEWRQISPVLDLAVKTVYAYRAKHDRDLHMPDESCLAVASMKFQELTGMANVNFWTIHHHRLKDWGKECPACGCLLMTPGARVCMHCGWEKGATKTVSG